MKYFNPIVSILIFASVNSIAQKKIAIEVSAGTNYSLNGYSPTEANITPVSKVENKRYFSLNHLINAHYHIGSNLSIGAGIGTQGFSWGWQPEKHYSSSGVGISSGGRFFSEDLYYIQLSVRHSCIHNKKFTLYHNLAIDLVDYTTNYYLKDTTSANSFFRYPRPEEKEILYKTFPIQERIGIHPLIVYNIGAEINLGKWLYITSRAGTQLGFKWLYRQEVEIKRQWEGESAIYRTRHNGSALTYHLGLGVRI